MRGQVSLTHTGAGAVGYYLFVLMYRELEGLCG